MATSLIPNANSVKANVAFSWVLWPLLNRSGSLVEMSQDLGPRFLMAILRQFIWETGMRQAEQRAAVCRHKLDRYHRLLTFGRGGHPSQRNVAVALQP
jgi:hypothetical protein